VPWAWMGGLASVVCGMAMAGTAAAQGRPEATQPPASKPPAASQPQLPELTTDRPDFTESSVIVGRGFVQLEMGSSFEVDRAGASHRTLTLPLALVRVGLGSHAELRVSGAGFAIDSVRSAAGRTNQSGGSDVELGVKVLVLDKPSAGFAFAALAMVSLPSGSPGLSSGGYDPTLKLTWAKSLPAGFSLSGNFNFSRLTDEAGRFSQRATSVSLSHDLKGGWGAYWEAYGFTPPERGERTAWTFDSGVSRSIGAHAQVDVEAGRGLTSSATDWFVGAGFAIRLAPFRRGR